MPTPANLSTYDIERPSITDNKWLVFNNTIFDDLDVMDCNDAIDGVCYTDKTLDECMSMCKDNGKCDAGYYIEGFKENICVPLRTSSYGNVNPIYRLRNQNIYPILENKKAITFINTNKFKFPLLQANTLFYMDHINIKNEETMLIMETSPIGSKQTDTKFTKDGNLQVQLIPIYGDNTLGVNYTPIKYGDPFSINIPGTSLILRQLPYNHTHHMTWIPRKDSLTMSDSFSILPINDSKQIGDEVYYSDKFYLKYSGFDIIVLSQTHHFATTYYGTYKDAILKNTFVTFSFIPQMKGYYCNDDSKCTEISIKDMSVNEHGIGTYNGIGIGRNPSCWGVCKYKNTDNLSQFDSYQIGTNLTLTWVVLVVVITVVTVIIVKTI